MNRGFIKTAKNGPALCPVAQACSIACGGPADTSVAPIAIDSKLPTAAPLVFRDHYSPSSSSLLVVIHHCGHRYSSSSSSSTALASGRSAS